MFCEAIRDPDYLSYLLLDGTRVMTGPLELGAAPSDTDGNWRIRHDGTDLLIEYRTGGAWVTKYKFQAT